jgi:hypothetical protein
LHYGREWRHKRSVHQQRCGAGGIIADFGSAYWIDKLIISGDFTDLDQVIRYTVPDSFVGGDGFWTPDCGRSYENESWFEALAPYYATFGGSMEACRSIRITQSDFIGDPVYDVRLTLPYGGLEPPAGPDPVAPVPAPPAAAGLLAGLAALGLAARRRRGAATLS